MTLQQHLKTITHDAILWLSIKAWKTAVSTIAQEAATKEIIDLLLAVPNQVRRDAYVKNICDAIAEINSKVADEKYKLQTELKKKEAEVKALRKQKEKLDPFLKKMDTKLGKLKEEDVAHHQQERAKLQSEIDTLLSRALSLEDDIEATNEKYFALESQPALPELPPRELQKYLKAAQEDAQKATAKKEEHNDITGDESFPKWAMERINELYMYDFCRKKLTIRNIRSGSISKPMIS